jgi:AraC-like DNA-binding protein
MEADHSLMINIEAGDFCFFIGIAEIAYAPGLENPAYFNPYFKGVRGAVPSSLRGQMV